MKIPDFSPSFFIGKNSKDIISFGSGQPDLPPPKEVFQILHDYTSFKYGLIQGQDNLRQALSREYPGSTPDSFVVTNGASEALDLTLRSIARQKSSLPKKILLPRPYYYSYPFLVEFSGMTPVYTDLVKGKVDITDFEEKVKECRAILINSPSNPTGRIESIKTLKQIEKITEDLGVYVISDEVYKDLIYERENYLIHGPKVVTVNSFSKTFSMCGFRVGYLWSRDSDLVNDVIAMKTHCSMNTNILGQEMAFEATKVPKKFVSDQLEIWKERRDLIYQGLCDMGLQLWKPEGAFYVFPKVKNPKKTVWELYTKHKVITYLGDWFGAPGHIRLSYALDKEKIEQGLELLHTYLKG